MKKLFTFLFVLGCLATFAQESTVQETVEEMRADAGEETLPPSSEFKPQAGQKTLEVQFEPFGDDPIGLNGIRGRKFTSSTRALRLNVFLGLDADTQVTQQADATLNLQELKDKTSVFSINIRPGMERHLAGTKKLSPYMGWELDIAFQTSSFRTENQVLQEVNFTKFINDNGFFRLGANLIAGFDFYFSKKIYMGTEFGFGASTTRLLKSRVKSDTAGFIEPDPQKRGGSFDIGPNVNTAIRLGYAF